MRGGFELPEEEEEESVRSTPVEVTFLRVRWRIEDLTRTTLNSGEYIKEASSEDYTNSGSGLSSPAPQEETPSWSKEEEREERIAGGSRTWLVLRRRAEEV